MQREKDLIRELIARCIEVAVEGYTHQRIDSHLYMIAAVIFWL